jgi:hypothetical protein
LGYRRAQAQDQQTRLASRASTAIRFSCRPQFILSRDPFVRFVHRFDPIARFRQKTDDCKLEIAGTGTKRRSEISDQLTKAEFVRHRVSSSKRDPDGRPDCRNRCLLDFDFSHHRLAALHDGLVPGGIKLADFPRVLVKHENDCAARLESRDEGDFDLTVDT